MPVPKLNRTSGSNLNGPSLPREGPDCEGPLGRRDTGLCRASQASVKPYDLFSKGNKKERARCLAALEALAPGVPEGFVRGTVMFILGEYPDTWRELAEFDARWKLDWARLYEHKEQTKEWVYRLEENAVWFSVNMLCTADHSSDRKDTLKDWQRA